MTLPIGNEGGCCCAVRWRSSPVMLWSQRVEGLESGWTASGWHSSSRRGVVSDGGGGESAVR